jgi:hypothetical protein
MKLYDIIHQKNLELTEQLREIEEQNIKFDVTTSINESNENIIELKYKNKRILYGHYDILGIYDVKNFLFEWAWNFQINKNTPTKKIYKFSETLLNNLSNNKYEDIDYLERIIYYVKNPIFFIDKKNINDLIKVSNYALNGNGILSTYDDENEKKRIFYIITDIIG